MAASDAELIRIAFPLLAPLGACLASRWLEVLDQAGLGESFTGASTSGRAIRAGTRFRRWEGFRVSADGVEWAVGTVPLRASKRVLYQWVRVG